MKVYRYIFSIKEGFKDQCFIPTVFEATEENENYALKEITDEYRNIPEYITIPKASIGCVKGNNPWSVYLLEDDFRKARTLIFNYAANNDKYADWVRKMMSIVDRHDREKGYIK